VASDTSSKKPRLESTPLTIATATPTPESTTPNFSDLIKLIEQNPNLESLLRQKYRPKMHPLLPGEEDPLCAFFAEHKMPDFLSEMDVGLTSTPVEQRTREHRSPSPEEERRSPASELDSSDDDEPMDISDGMSLNKGNTSAVTVARPRSGVHRALFSMQDLPSQERSIWTRFYAALRLDFIAKGPASSSETTDDRQLIEMIMRRHRDILGARAAPMGSFEITSVLSPSPFALLSNNHSANNVSRISATHCQSGLI
jgi:hypothetical protein